MAEAIPPVVQVPVQKTQTWDLGPPVSNSDDAVVVGPVVVGSPTILINGNDLPRGGEGKAASPATGTEVIPAGRFKNCKGRHQVAMGVDPAAAWR